jgi:type II secretory pathway pseudopilin PulG
MIVKRRAHLLLAGTVIGTSLLVAVPALADDAQSQQLQNQINAMQQQLQALQNQVAQAKQQAQAAEQAVQNVPANLYNAAPPGSAPMVTKGMPAWFGGIHISLAGSFIESAGVWREHNEQASGASDTPFGTLPFPNSPLYHENELEMSAQQSRLALKASGDIDPLQHLAAYYEMDFLGAGVTANSRESNSYNLRVRQAWLGYDNDNWHFHLMAGQGWSMLTQDRVGIAPLYENVPLTIDAQYVAGFNWARQPQFRFVEDFNKIAWFGFSVEAPQVNFQSNSIGVVGGGSQGSGVVGQTSTGGNSGVLPPGVTGINDINACQASGLLNSTTGCSINNYPDFIEKFALDPGWGHYEVFGLERLFTDQVFTTAATAAAPGVGSDKTTFGWGVGGSVLLPAWPKVLDLQGSVLYGAGTGRYGSAQLPDVAIGSNGSLQPLTTVQFLVGGVAHPVDPLDVYVYYGEEQIVSRAAYGTSAATAGGYGSPFYANTGCLTENTASGPAGFNDPIAGLACTGPSNLRSVWEITGGFWYNVYKGDLGRVRVGLQYEYFQVAAFSGAGGPTVGSSTPNAGINPFNEAVFVSLRYYPFN